MKKILIVLSALVALLGCGPQRPKGIKDCQFHLADVKTLESELTYTKLGLEIDATNPNGVDIIVDHMIFRLYANGQEVGSGAASYADTPIPPGESVKFKAKIAVDYFSAGVAIFNMIKSGSVSYSLHAKVYYETPFGAYHSGSTISSAFIPGF